MNKLYLTGLLYVAWIDNLFVDCFGLFHMVLARGYIATYKLIRDYAIIHYYGNE